MGRSTSGTYNNRISRVIHHIVGLPGFGRGRDRIQEALELVRIDRHVVFSSWKSFALNVGYKLPVCGATRRTANRPLVPNHRNILSTASVPHPTSTSQTQRSSAYSLNPIDSYKMSIPVSIDVSFQHATYRLSFLYTHIEQGEPWSQRK